MSNREKPIRQSVTLPRNLAARVRSMERQKKTSSNRVLVDLIETGLQSKEAEKRRFFALADQLGSSTNKAEQKRIKEELASLTFGS